MLNAAVPASTAVSVSVSVRVPVLDAERLDCYRVAVAFQVLASTLLPKGQPALRDQLERASVSVVLNTAEGGATVPGGRRRPQSIGCRMRSCEAGRASSTWT